MKKIVLVLLLSMLLAACTSLAGATETPTPAPTPSPTGTATPVPTATETPTPTATATPDLGAAPQGMQNVLQDGGRLDWANGVVYDKNGKEQYDLQNGEWVLNFTPGTHDVQFTHPVVWQGETTSMGTMASFEGDNAIPKLIAYLSHNAKRYTGIYEMSYLFSVSNVEWMRYANVLHSITGHVGGDSLLPPVVYKGQSYLAVDVKNINNTDTIVAFQRGDGSFDSVWVSDPIGPVEAAIHANQRSTPTPEPMMSPTP